MEETPKSPSNPTSPPAGSGNVLKLLLAGTGCLSLVLIIVVAVLFAILAGRPAPTESDADNNRGGPTTTAQAPDRDVPGDPGSGTKDVEPDCPAVDDDCVPSDDLPEIFFTPGGLFDEDLRDEFLERYVLPMALWEKDQGNQPLVVEVSENPYEETVGTYPYTVAMFQLEGLYSGAALELTPGGDIPLFIPECFESVCEFSPEFEASFPDNVAAYEALVSP